jgi:hypothetical protein
MIITTSSNKRTVFLHFLNFLKSSLLEQEGTKNITYLKFMQHTSNFQNYYYIMSQLTANSKCLTTRDRVATDT